jgi:ABC-type antimicrobial peptide transport system permease subunit
MFFVPLMQFVAYPAGDMLERVEVRSHFVSGLMLTTNATPGALEPVVTKILADVDPNLTITSVRTMREQVAVRFDQDRAVASLAVLFGGVALLLAAVGLYGVTAYGVAQRRNEIGIRVALGADRGRVVGLVLRGTAARVGAGLALGVPLAIAAGRLLQAQLYGVSSWDPVALGVAAGALALCASAAAIIPARRAASIPAVDALRAE